MIQKMSALPGSRVSVFVADDHGMFCQGLVRLLGDDVRFHVLGSATQEREALGRIRDLAPEVAILSFAAQGMDGIGLTSRIIAENLATRCIVLSQRDERYVSQRAFLAGAKGCVFKEASFQVLAESILRIAAGESGVRSHGQPEAKPAPAADPGLSKRELEVLRLVGRGLTSRQIAECLFISARTVDSHRMKLLRKLDIQNAAGLVKYAFEHNLDSW